MLAPHITPEMVQANRDYLAAWLAAHRSIHEVADAAKDPSGAEFLLLDVRSRSSFSRGHVPGAFSVPLTELHALAVRLPRGMPVVTYCAGGT